MVAPSCDRGVRIHVGLCDVWSLKGGGLIRAVTDALACARVPVSTAHDAFAIHSEVS